MFRPTWAVALMVLTQLGSLAPAIAQEREDSAGERQIAVDLGARETLRLTLVPSGEFTMGESAEATASFINKTYGQDFLAWNFEDQEPLHRVRITKPFYLGIYHVTRGQFRRFVRDTGYITDAEKGEKPGGEGWNPDKQGFEHDTKYSWRDTGFEQTDEHPVVNVSWNDAVAFCEWLSHKEGRIYRLPTEAEWEYACRAGTITRYLSGDDPEALAKVANVADATMAAKLPGRKGEKSVIRARDGYVFTSPVGSFRPNAFGLFDMLGNAWQWCADTYVREYYTESPTDDPRGPASGPFRVLRGGSWSTGAAGARSAERDWFTPDHRNLRIGFRIAMSQ